ncbi:MAG: putative lipid II flippase FtsW, partial [Pyrinomonadaceae bacterium]
MIVRKIQFDEWLFATAAGLSLFGVVMVYSASAPMAAQQGSPYYFMIKQAVWTGIGMMGLFAGLLIDYHRLNDRRIVYGSILLLVLLLLVVLEFPRINGAHRWIRFRGFSMQPSELAKTALILFLAHFLSRRLELYGVRPVKDAVYELPFFRGFVPCLFVTGLLAGLIVIEPDLGTALMLCAACLILTLISGVRLRYLLMASAPALLGVLSLLVFVPWRMKRLVMFLDPWADPQGSGYQVVQSLIAVGTGGTGGAGFAGGKQKFFFLPFAHSDFIFSVIGEELGLIGAAVVILLFGLLLWRGLRISLRAPDAFGMLLGIGIVTMIVTQALLNISVVLSLVPTKGIPLPFISYGGSSIVPMLFSIGVLLNISRYSNLHGGLTKEEVRGTVVRSTP